MTAADQVWAEPLNELERHLIEEALDSNRPEDLKLWLTFCVQIFDAQHRVRVNGLLSEVEASLKPI